MNGKHESGEGPFLYLGDSSGTTGVLYLIKMIVFRPHNYYKLKRV